jgi:4-amino-4-deoxychorismate lyase
MTAAVLINGMTPADPSHALSVEDRGFQYGDGVFESALLVNGRVRFFDEHLQRLALGCERLGIRAPDVALIKSDVHRLAGSTSRSVLKIIVSRGIGPRSYRPPMRPEPTRVVALYPAPQLSSAPLAVRWCDMRLARNARLAGIKHLNRLEQVLAQAEWNDEHISEGLMLDTEGELVSATASNVFLVRDGMLVTPDLRFCGVRGILRAEVLRAAAQLGIAVSEEPLWPYDVDSASEVFLTNSIRGIRSVATLGPLQWESGVIADKLQRVLEL